MQNAGKKEKKMEFSGKKVTVVGTGISGIGAVGLLNAVGAEVVLYDGNEKLKIEDIEKKLGTYKAEIVLGELTKELTDSSDLLVISPGVPIDSPVVKAFEAAGVPVWGEVELAYAFDKGKVLAITGTNGKTTTTALVGQIVGAYHKDTFVVGNIGNPYTTEVLKSNKDSYTVAEISSFQLETMHTVGDMFKILEDDIAAIENMFTRSISSIISNVFILIGVTSYLIHMHRKIGFFLIIFTVIIVWIQKRYGKKLENFAYPFREEVAMFSSYTNEVLNNIINVEMCGIKEKVNENYCEKNKKIVKKTLQQLKLITILKSIISSYSISSLFVIMMIGAGEVLANKMSVGDLVSLLLNCTGILFRIGLL